MECEASITEAECGCRALHMPKLNEDVRICDQRDSECYERIKFQTEYFGDESLLCECLPACYEIGYETELSSAPVRNLFMFFFILLSNDMVPDEQRRLYVRNNTAILHVYLKDTSFRSFTKTEFIGFTEFLCKKFFTIEIWHVFIIICVFKANTGGLLGLFLGFSVLSVMEIIYFVSMRPYCLTKKEKQLARKARKIKKNFLQANLNQGNHNEQIKNAWVGNKKSRKIGVLPYVE
uniref:CSON014572 protein n=1 Tax=Culicoides sonorensis TaxID=179676 RepID=A0A336MC11_CULSO